MLDLLAFVDQARRLGLTLSEIRGVIALHRAGTPPCRHVQALLAGKAADLDGLLRELRHILDSGTAATAGSRPSARTSR